MSGTYTLGAPERAISFIDRSISAKCSSLHSGTSYAMASVSGDWTTSAKVR